MAILDDEEIQNGEPLADPLRGRTRVKAEVTVQVDTGTTTYGARQWEDQHSVELMLGSEANAHSVQSIVSNLVGSLLHVNDDPNAGLKTMLHAVLDAQLEKAKADLAAESHADAEAKSDPEDVRSDAALTAYGHLRNDPS